MKTIKITPEWVLENLSHTLDTDEAGIISLYTGNASDANWIELALNSLEISFDTYDYLSDYKELVFGFDFRIEDIESECPILYNKAREIERNNNDNKQGSSDVDCGTHGRADDTIESEASRIIDEYKEQNKVEHITEEEFTNLFWESTLYQNYYYTDCKHYFEYFSISEYEYRLLKNGYNPFTGQFFSDYRADYNIIDGVDEIDPTDVESELFWVENNLSFEQGLEQAAFLDRYCPFLNQCDIFTCAGFYSIGDNVNEYYRIVDSVNQFDFMKIEEPVYLNQGEIECFPGRPSDDINTVRLKESETLPMKLVKKKDWTKTTGYKKAKERLNRLKKLIIVREYEEQNKIARITDEEITNIFGESELFPEYMFDNSKECLDFWKNHDIMYWSILTDEIGPKCREYLFKREPSFDLVEAESLSEGEYYFELNSELDTKMPSNIIPPADLHPEIIRSAIEKSELKYWDETVDMPAEQSIAVMLKITFFFKQIVERREKPYVSFCRKMGELDSSMIEMNEFDLISDIELPDIYRISDLLLQTLHSLNGSYYRIHDRDYDWEDRFLDIFIYMPYGEEFNRAMINILLWPLYKDTHDMDISQNLK